MVSDGNLPRVFCPRINFHFCDIGELHNSRGETETSCEESRDSSVKPHSHGNYSEFLENAEQLFCQFLDLPKLMRPQTACPSPRAQSLANSAS